jgi:DNA gyrase subunit B
VPLLRRVTLVRTRRTGDSDDVLVTVKKPGYFEYGGMPVPAVLTGLQAVRKRPEMYLDAKTDDPRLPGQALWVVVRDALGDVPVNPTLTVSVVVESDLAFCVEDDGPGLRVDPVGPRRAPWATEALTLLTGGPRGALLAMVTAVSGAAVADIWRDGQHWRQCADWQHPGPALQLVGPTDRHGTRLRYHLDASYLGARAALPTDISGLLTNLLDDVRDHAVLTITDKRIASPPELAR